MKGSSSRTLRQSCGHPTLLVLTASMLAGTALVGSPAIAMASSVVYTVTNTADSGSGSLRQAVLSADGQGSRAFIRFSIGSGPQVITPATPLPPVTASAVIDGTTQPGYNGTPLIQLDGSGMAAGSAVASGLTVQAGSSVVSGLEITRWSGDGIDLGSGGRDVIISNYIGTDGSLSLSNGGSGIVVTTGSKNNQIGNDVGGGNIISGNHSCGVDIEGSDNHVQGNYIGTDASGTLGVSNGSGVCISGHFNTLGGSTAATRNVISSNGVFGPFVFYGSGVDVSGRGNRVEGNYIGTDVTGTNPLGNAAGGVFIGGGANNTIGGDRPGAGNLISANGGTGFGNGVETFATTGDRIEGNYIGTDAGGTGLLPNGLHGVRLGFGTTDSTVGGDTPAARNVISGNIGNGVRVEGTGVRGNRVEGNYIGTDSAGETAIGNSEDGVCISGGATNTRVGGGNIGSRNLISGNSRDGILITGSGTSGVQIQNSYIGTDKSGSKALGNTFAGVEADLGATNITVGSSDSAAHNVISGNGLDGVRIWGTGTSNVRVAGNYIGTTASGAAPLSNSDGVVVYGGASRVVVGGDAVGARNVISSSVNFGVFIGDSTNVSIAGNYIGTDATGTTALGNTYGVRIDGSNIRVGGDSSGTRNLISGNSRQGVILGGSGNRLEGNFIGTDATGTKALGNVIGVTIDATNATVGGTDIGARNVISGNDVAGVIFSGSGFSGDAVIGNYIGTDASGTSPLGNIGDGIDVFGGTLGSIGGTGHRAGNIIAYNRGNAINLGGSSITGYAVHDNSIFASQTLPGITFGSEPAPTIASVNESGSSTVVVGAVAFGRHRVEVFANASCFDPEGAIFLGFADTSSGHWSISVTPRLLSGVGVTATSTNDSTNSTSGFSSCVSV